MLIESKIKRDGGTHVTIDTTAYHFAPQDDGAHVATVTDEAHQDRFLSITEGYRVYRGAEKAAASTDETVEGDMDGDGDVDRADLVAQHEAKFGKKPHAKMSAAKLRAALAEE
jgi:hypothetical protein